MSESFFGADYHFGHDNIRRLCNRNFPSIEAMNECMYNRINSRVGIKDRLYIIGDYSYKGSKPKEYLKRINCQNIYLVIGNHDIPEDWKELLGSYNKIKDVDKAIGLYYHKQSIYLSHYPMRSWPGSYGGKSWNLYGHCHSKLDNEDRRSGFKTLDVGVDNCENYGKMFAEPWSFDEVKTVMETRTGEMNV